MGLAVGDVRIQFHSEVAVTVACDYDPLSSPLRTLPLGPNNGFLDLLLHVC